MFNLPEKFILLLYPFLTAFVLSVITIPLTIKIARKYNLVDDPNKKPHPAHIQSRIVPKAGGLPIFISIVVSILFFVPLDKHVIGIIIGSLALLIVGLIDDAVVNLSPYPRLLVQFFAAAIVVAAGVGVTFVTNPFGGILRLDYLVIPLTIFGAHNIIVIADILAFLLIVWMMNMANWSWGVDGQMPGIIATAAITIGFIAFKLYIAGDTHQINLAILSFITAGSAIGFLLFNWAPAKIFSGDSGSNILGFMIATLSILSGAKVATALLILLVPSIDFFYTFFRRILSGKAPFFGDQKHLHHLLLRRGWSHQQISLVYIFSSILLAIISMSIDAQEKLFFGIVIAIILIGIILWLQLFTANIPITPPEDIIKPRKKK